MHKCELETIAETATKTEQQDYCTEQTKTMYHLCTSCGKIYEEITEARTYEGYKKPGAKYQLLTEYKGSLSAQELTKHARKHIGTITQQDEQRLIKLRN